MKPDELFLEIRLADGLGRTHAAVRRSVPSDVGFQGQRAAEDFRLGVAFAGSTEPFADAVKMLHKKEMRRGKLREMCAALGDALADFLHDREGWSDPDRQSRTEEIALKRNS